MIRSVASKVMWVGRATFFLVGLAVVLFLTLAIVAQAADARVPSLKKGVVNTVNSVTKLVGTLTDPILRLDNNGTGPALDLQVEPGHAPMTVNSSTQVANLNADQVDGKSASAFVANSVYMLGPGQEREGTLLGDGTRVLSQSCLTGDRLLAGGPASVRDTSDLLDSFPTDTNTWQARINPNGQTDTFTVVVLCADQ